MLGRIGISLATLVAAVGVASGATDAINIRWHDLRPADQKGGSPETPAAARAMAAQGATLSTGLTGKQVEIAGYVLPVDRDGDLVYEFMLLPLTGLCSHVPAPPPNQVVHVIPAKPYKLKEIYEPVKITGTLKPEIETTQLFILDGVTVMESGYSIGRAAVARTDAVPETAPTPNNSPWKALTDK